MYSRLKNYRKKDIKVVATVQNFICTGPMDQKVAIFLSDIIDAETGDYLASHAYIHLTDEIKEMDLGQYDKFVFIGRPNRRKKKGNGFYFDRVHNAVSKKDSDTCLEHLAKLQSRKKYITGKKEVYSSRKEEVRILIDEAEASKLKFKNNPLLSVHPHRTIEPIFTNRFHRFSLAYALVDTLEKRSLNGLDFKESFDYFRTIYRDIREVNKNRDKIRRINHEVIDSHREMRELNRKGENIDGLINSIDRCSNILESRVHLTRDIFWEPLYPIQNTLTESKTKVKTFN